MLSIFKLFVSYLSLEDTIIKPHYSEYSNDEEFGVSDGFIRSAGNRNAFYSVDGKTVLDKVLVAE